MGRGTFEGLSVPFKNMVVVSYVRVAEWLPSCSISKESPWHRQSIGAVH